MQCRLYTTIHSTSERKDEYPFFEKIMPVLNEGLKQWMTARNVVKYMQYDSKNEYLLLFPWQNRYPT